MLRRTLITGILLTAAAYAQIDSFPKPSYFRETFKKPDTKVELQPPVRLQDFVATGEGCAQTETIKLPAENQQPAEAAQLGLETSAGQANAPAEAPPAVVPPSASSRVTAATVAVPAAAPPPVTPGKCLRLGLKDFLDLVMANNTDIQVSFLSVETAKNNITSVYGFWDPRASFSFKPSLSRSDSLPNSPFHTVGQTENFPLTFGFSQNLSTGQSISIGGNGSKSASWGGNPNYYSGLNFSLTQPLIQNRGSYITRIPLMQAQSSLKVSQFVLRNSLINAVSAAETAYWNVVSARESLFVAQRSREVQRQLLAFDVKQFQLGAISDLDLYRVQSQMALAEVSVSSAEFTLRRAVDTLRKQIAADLDPAVRDLPIVLTDSPELSAQESIVPDREREVQMAIATHPTIQRYLETLSADDLSLASARNGLLPQLNLTAGYAGAGNGGTYTGGFSSGYYGPPIPGGLGDALGQAFGWGNPAYSLGLTLTLPIRSRSASMAMANALIGKRNDALTLRTQQQSIRLNVLNAITSLEGDIQQLQLAQTAADWGQKDYDAQTLKYTLGTSNQIDVVQAANTLAGQLQAVVTAQINLRLGLLSLYQQTGELLDRRGIVVR
ncbi:MAG: TolC family protein [Bryobacteraceae bacterium]|jgi:outer membrane protein TolC